MTDFKRSRFVAPLGIMAILTGCSFLQPTAEPVMEIPAPPALMLMDQPRTEREFRAAWVATVANIDWPSKPGLTTTEQQAEALVILDSAALLNLNAIIFQVRPQCDALYNSKLEPWSFYLTGEQGKAPEPYYDPLKFWIDEAHKRGLQLHAWFNPYRAHHPAEGEIGEHSIVKTRPELVKKLADDGFYWLDPAKKETQGHSLAVVMDVVENYDVDGIHFDDYFYPYPSYVTGGDFPDDDTWAEYLAGGGTLSRGDWRRDAVNTFIRELYQRIKTEKPWVQFGLSPFGIWKPSHPESIAGFNQYEQLYADAKLWLNEGWVDYFTPQLYWPIAQIPQSYPVLLGWWEQENTLHRNLWPGVFTSRAREEGRALEIVNKIMVTRGMLPESPGIVHFSMKALQKNFGGVSDRLINGPYAQKALPPRSPWLDDIAPSPPRVTVTMAEEANQLNISWVSDDSDPVFNYVVYYKQGKGWRYTILNENDLSLTIPVYREIILNAGTTVGVDQEVISPVREYVTQIAVSSVDRLGNESKLIYTQID